MQSVKHDCCTLVFYFSKLDCRNCFLITVSRFAFPRFVLEKGLVTYGNALWFTVHVEILNYFYTSSAHHFYYFFWALLLLLSHILVMRISNLWQVGGSNSTYCCLCMCKVEIWECGLHPLRWDKLYSFRELSQFYFDLTHREVICKKRLKKQVCSVGCL